MDDKEIAAAVAIAVTVIPASPEKQEAIGKLLTQFLTDFSDLTISLGCMSSIAIDHHKECMDEDDAHLAGANPEGSC